MSFEELEIYSRFSDHDIVFTSNIPRHYVVSEKLMVSGIQPVVVSASNPA